MSTLMPFSGFALRACRASLVLALVGGCAPTHEWINPALPLANREIDIRDCRNEAAYEARRYSWLQRDRLIREYWWARTPGDRAMANARLHQIELIESMDRSRLFDHCMGLRGYALREIEGAR